MSNEEIVEEFKRIIKLIKQDGQDWVDERDIPLFEGAIKELLREQEHERE